MRPLRYFLLFFFAFAGLSAESPAQRIPLSAYYGSAKYTRTTYTDGGIISGTGLLTGMQLCVSDLARGMGAKERSRFRAGELIMGNLGLGYNSRSNSGRRDCQGDECGISIPLWLLLQLNLGAQATYLISDDLEVGIRWYKMFILDAARNDRPQQHFRSADDMQVAGASLRYKRLLLEPAIGFPFRKTVEPQLFERQHYTLSGRWLVTDFAFLGLQYDYFSAIISSTPSNTGSPYRTGYSGSHGLQATFGACF